MADQIIPNTDSPAVALIAAALEMTLRGTPQNPRPQPEEVAKTFVEVHKIIKDV